MNLEQFGEELKRARLEKGISLPDISVETRINQKFLEAIESGQFQILPQTYVRAFLREYAQIVNLDPIDIMEQYDSACRESYSIKPDDTISQRYLHKDKVELKNPEQQTLHFSAIQRNLIFGIVLIAAIILVIVLASISRETESNKSISELPFDRVVQESEAASIQFPSAVVDSAPVVLTPQIDSLRLEITTLDSVWISLLIDGKKGADYLFGPNKRRTWTAMERFSITMGNAGGATFRLNNKDIGTLGKRGAVIRNTVITKAYLNN